MTSIERYSTPNLKEDDDGMSLSEQSSTVTSKSSVISKSSKSRSFLTSSLKKKRKKKKKSKSITQTTPQSSYETAASSISQVGSLSLRISPPGSTLSSEFEGTSVTSPTSTIKSSDSYYLSRPTNVHEISIIMEEYDQLIQEFPDGSHDPKDTALHIACSKQYSDSLIIDHFLKPMTDLRDMVFKTNSSIELPLHLAVKKKMNPSVNVVNALLEINPGSINATKNDNSLPIHLACQAGVPSVPILNLLISNFPESLYKKSDIVIPFDSRNAVIDELAEAENDDEFHESDDGDKSSLFCNFCNFFSSQNTNSTNLLTPSFEEINNESSFTPLHLAILNHASPEAIQLLVTKDTTASLNLKTNKNRKPMDIAKAMIKYHEKYDNDNSEEMKHTFATIEILQTFEKNLFRQRSLRRTITMTNDSLRYLNTVQEENENEKNSNKFNAKREWQKLSTTIAFVNAVNTLRNTKSALGKKTLADKIMDVKCPDGFQHQKDLDNVNLDEVVPVGFKRLRWAILSSQSKFITDTFLKEDQKVSKIKMGKWSEFDDIIGKHHSPDHQDTSQFIGASRKCQYLMPKSGFVNANTAHQEITILEYSDYCFAVKMVTRNPEVPYGKTFEAHTQHVFINAGDESCRVICSVSTVFVGKQPMIGWKIRNAMYSGTMSSDVSLMEAICANAA